MSTPSAGDAEPTLVQKLRQIADATPGDPMKCLCTMAISQHAGAWCELLSDIAREAADALEARWQPIETAPLEPHTTAASYYQFRCLLQDARGHVCEGWGYWVLIGRATTSKTLRWKSANDRQFFPVAWMPLPAPCSKPAPRSGSPRLGL